MNIWLSKIALREWTGLEVQFWFAIKLSRNQFHLLWIIQGLMEWEMAKGGCGLWDGLKGVCVYWWSGRVLQCLLQSGWGATGVSPVLSVVTLQIFCPFFLVIPGSWGKKLKGEHSVLNLCYNLSQKTFYVLQPTSPLIILCRTMNLNWWY